MKKIINSIVALGITVVMCIFASWMVVRGSEESSSFIDYLDIFLLNVVFCFFIVYFYNPVRFYITGLCVFLGVMACRVINGAGSVEDGRLLLMTTLFLCLGAAAVFSKSKVYFFPMKKLAIPLGGWVALFVLLDVVMGLISGKSVLGGSVKVRAIATVCGVGIGVVGMLINVVCLKQFGAAAGAWFLVDGGKDKNSLFKPVKIQKGAVSSANISSTALPSKAAVSSSSDRNDVKKSILDAKLAAMCSGKDGKPAGAVKNTSNTTQEAAPKPSTDATAKPVPKAPSETGKIVSSVDFA